MAKRANNVGPVPTTTDEAIDEALKQYVDTEAGAHFQLGVYGKQSLRRASAVNGNGLVSLRSLIEPLIRAQPEGRFCQKQLEARLSYLFKNANGRRFNTSTFPDDIFAFFVSKRLMVVFYHWRKVLQDKRFGECCSKMKKEDREELHGMVLSLTGHRPNIQAEGKRKLKKQVSLDDDGYPTMLNDVSTSSDEGEAPTTPPKTTATRADPSSSSAKSYKDALDFLDTISSDGEHGEGEEATSISGLCLEVAKLALPAKKGAIKAKALKNRAAGAEPARTADSESFGRIRIGPFSQKSYIQKQEGKSWKSILNISGMPQEMHHRIAWKLFFYACNNATDEAELREWRDKYHDMLKNGEDISDDEEPIPAENGWDS